MKTFKGKPVTLLGDMKKVGDKAPDFKALTTKNELVHLKDFKQPYIVLNVVPSLDTTVCDLQARTVNRELSSRGDVLVITISNDLPFAQSRWCGNSGIENVITLSDYLELDFANKFGVHMKENRLLARSVFVLDSKRNVIYAEYVEEMTTHINYDQLIGFVKQMPEE